MITVTKLITVAKLRRPPRHFQAFTGLTVLEFDHLLAPLAPAYETALHQARQRAERQRNPGAGRRFRICGGTSRIRGIIKLGAVSKAEIKTVVSLIKLSLRISRRASFIRAKADI